MQGQERIDEVFAFVAVDTDGTEGVPAVGIGKMVMPLMGADTARMDSMMASAQEVTDKLGKQVELVVYRQREHVRWLEPRLRVDLCVKCAKPVLPDEAVVIGGPPEHLVCPHPPEVPGRAGFEHFDEPQLVDASTTVQAKGIIVAGLIVDGEPGIQITYMVGNDVLPGITVSGEQAEDLVRLSTDALAAAKETLQ